METGGGDELVRPDWLRRARLALVVAGAGIAACSGGLGTGPLERRAREVELEESRDRWQALHYGDYVYTLRRSCFCTPESTRPMRIRVHAGVVVSAIYVDDGTPVPAGLEFAVLTVDQLFALADDAIRHADEVDVTYDDAVGYPRRIAIDHIRQAVDDEITYEASDLAPVQDAR
jgi:hypothetical protein